MNDLVYLDNAATSFPKPEAVHGAMGDFYRRAGVSPGRSLRLLLDRHAFVQLIDNARLDIVRRRAILLEMGHGIGSGRHGLCLNRFQLALVSFAQLRRDDPAQVILHVNDIHQSDIPSIGDDFHNSAIASLSGQDPVPTAARRDSSPSCPPSP